MLRSRSNVSEVLDAHAILKATVTATEANHIAYAGPCKLYGAFLNSPTAAVLGSNVRFIDGASGYIKGAGSVQKGEVSAVVFDPPVVIITDLRVEATKLESTGTTPDSGDNPDVTLIVGY